jgi:hypothetical protein
VLFRSKSYVCVISERVVSNSYFSFRHLYPINLQLTQAGVKEVFDEAVRAVLHKPKKKAKKCVIL